MSFIWGIANGLRETVSACVYPHRPEEEEQEPAVAQPEPEPAAAPPAQVAAEAPAQAVAEAPAPMPAPAAPQGEPDDEIGPGWEPQENKESKWQSALSHPFLAISPVRRRRLPPEPQPPAESNSS